LPLPAKSVVRPVTNSDIPPNRPHELWHEQRHCVGPVHKVESRLPGDGQTKKRRSLRRERTWADDPCLDRKSIFGSLALSDSVGGCGLAGYLPASPRGSLQTTRIYRRVRHLPPQRQ